MKAWVKITLIFYRELRDVKTGFILLKSLFIKFVALHVDQVCKGGIEQLNLHRLDLWVLLFCMEVRKDQNSIFLTLKNVAELDLLLGHQLFLNYRYAKVPLLHELRENCEAID
jgi:hypothetical protein